MKRGQASLIGFILVLAIITVVFPMVGSMLQESAKEQAPNLQLYADSVLDTLMRPGVPENWNLDNVKRPGFGYRSQVNEELLLKYQILDYPDTKRMLGLGSEEYVFFFKDETGQVLTVGDKQSGGWKGDSSSGNGAIEWDPTWQEIKDSALNLAKAEKPVSFRGKVVQLVVYVWAGQYIIPYELIAACNNKVDDDMDGFTDFPWDPGCTSPEDPTEFDLPSYPQCFDQVDNDLDGLVDYPTDPGCTHAADNDETDPPTPPQCANSLDDDSDLYIDFPADDGCLDAADDDESSTTIPPPTSDQCNDDIDNDFDGWIDFPLDPGCNSLTDGDETDAGTPPLCANGVDDDLDTKIDFPWDPGCTFAGDTDETDPPTITQCADGTNNDADLVTDFPNDYGCDYASDDDEANPASLSACHDGADNDGDGFTDYHYEPGCGSTTDSSEYNYGRTQCSDGQDNDGNGQSDYPGDSLCMMAADMSEFFSSSYGGSGQCGDHQKTPGEQCERGWTRQVPKTVTNGCGETTDYENQVCTAQCKWQAVSTELGTQCENPGTCPQDTDYCNPSSCACSNSTHKPILRTAVKNALSKFITRCSKTCSCCSGTKQTH